MPSLIYIARIRSLSEELTQSLRSAGCHVESFKPGDITQDECLLAMTPEAAEAAVSMANLRRVDRSEGKPAAVAARRMLTRALLTGAALVLIGAPHQGVAHPLGPERRGGGLGTRRAE